MYRRGRRTREEGRLAVYEDGRKLNLTEDRPYKAGMGHAKTIAIMRSMVEEGKIDRAIAMDIDTVFGAGKESGQYVFDETVKKWKCRVCGYISEGELPPDQCPVCHSDSGDFSAAV